MDRGSPVTASHDWPIRHAPPVLEPSEIHIWRAKVPDEARLPVSWPELLTTEEQARVSRQHFAVDARRSLTSRACLRLLLGHYLGLPPLRIVLGTTAEGKPTLVGPVGPDSIEFNLSHSAEWIVVGFSRGSPLGIDIEHCRDLDFDELVAGFFSPIERKAWTAVPSIGRREAFFAAWTRKEAYLKALGVGFSKPLDSFAVTFEAGAGGKLVWCSDNPHAPQNWRIVSINPAFSYTGALALDSSIHRLKTFTFAY